MSDLINRIVIDSAYGPQIVIDKPLAPDPNAPAPWYLQLLKPQITIVTPLGTRVIAPYGAPGETQWPTVQLILLLIVCLIIGVVVYRLV
jgi:hypothetical protein